MTTTPSPPDWRVALEQAAHELDVAENALLCSSFHNAAARAKQAARAARAALAQPEPEVVGPTDAELEALADQFWVENSVNFEAEHYAFARAVLARWGRPAPAPAGEVGELVADLRDAAFDLNGSNPAKWMLTRAADLLERQAAPVPVAAEVYFEFVVSDADYCTQAGGIAPSYAQAVDEGQNYLAQYQQDGPHTLEVRRVEVLPLPSVEAEE